MNLTPQKFSNDALNTVQNDYNHRVNVTAKQKETSTDHDSGHDSTLEDLTEKQGMQASKSMEDFSEMITKDERKYQMLGKVTKV